MPIKGEIFKINNKETIEKISFSDEEINEKYLKGEIRIITEQARYPLDTISNMISNSSINTETKRKYNLNPEYQRRKRWDVEQQSKLIESFIINVPIPPIFLYEIEYAQYEVMDGLQRLTAIDDFYNGKFELKGLEEWKELNGKKYRELPEKIREGIDRRYLSSIILLNETAKSPEEAEFLKKIVFGRLNSGGDKLTAQETRNAIYGGKFNSFCIELSKNDDFRKLWNFPLFKIDGKNIVTNEKELLDSGDPYRKMEDVELVLRFFAFRHIDKFPSSFTQEKFLDEFLFQANNFSDETINSLKKIFESTVKLIYDLFGNQAFYMPDGKREKKTPTKTIYDPLMQSISKILSKKELLLSVSEEIKAKKFLDKNKLKTAGKNESIDLFDGKYNSKSNVLLRVKYFDDFFSSIINS